MAETEEFDRRYSDLVEGLFKISCSEIQALASIASGNLRDLDEKMKQGREAEIEPKLPKLEKFVHDHLSIAIKYS